ncbi:MAG: transketolase family protein [Firmicutes bacterium]|nr:transketolase family protein [Bacillota bacterium]
MSASVARFEMKPTRFGYSEALLALGREDDRIVVLDADLAKSTTTERFKERFPGRFFDMGIAEQNMLGMAAGLSLAGFVPFVSTYGVFLSGRAWDQIRTTISYGGLNVKLGGAHGGLSVGPDGATHQALEEITLTRVLPGMTVLVPADYQETIKATRAAAAVKGPVYIRFGRAPVPMVTRPEDPFMIGKANTYREGGDITIISTGAMLAPALRAADNLASRGIQARVLNMHTIKPLDVDAVVRAAKETGGLVTVEEHQINGGLGGAVAECLVENFPAPMERVGIRDTFGESGEPDELQESYGLTAEEIEAAARRVIERKGPR